MATINFSVPEEVKREFVETFAAENRSAIVADLMRRAVEERRRRDRRAAAIDALLQLRAEMPATSDAEIAEARRRDRP